MEIIMKRAYEPLSEDDGFRILVDRLWPRGKSKEDLKIDLWIKEVSPSQELREWYGHDPAKWDEFRRRYDEELKNEPEAVDKLLSVLKRHKKVVFIYSAKEKEYNNAEALKEYVEERLGRRK